MINGKVANLLRLSLINLYSSYVLLCFQTFIDLFLNILPEQRIVSIAAQLPTQIRHIIEFIRKKVYARIDSLSPI